MYINPFEEVKKQIDIVAERVGLDPNITVQLKHPRRIVTVAVRALTCWSRKGLLTFMPSLACSPPVKQLAYIIRRER